MTQSSGLGARIVASVVATKFGTAFSVLVCRGGLVGAGAACTPTATANSSVVVSSNCLVGRVIHPSLGFQRLVCRKIARGRKPLEFARPGAPLQYREDSRLIASWFERRGPMREARVNVRLNGF